MIESLMWSVLGLLIIAISTWVCVVLVMMARIKHIRRRYMERRLSNGGAYYLLTARAGITSEHARLKVALWEYERPNMGEGPDANRLTAPADRERGRSGAVVRPRRPRP